jgi:hypothetical protein
MMAEGPPALHPEFTANATLPLSFMENTSVCGTPAAEAVKIVVRGPPLPLLMEMLGHAAPNATCPGALITGLPTLKQSDTSAMTVNVYVGCAAAGAARITTTANATQSLSIDA